MFTHNFSYLARAIVEVANITSCPTHELELVLVFGPSFLEHMLPSFVHYIKTGILSKLVKSVVIEIPPAHLKPENFRSLRIR